MITLLIFLPIVFAINENYEQKFNEINKIFNQSIKCNQTNFGYKCTTRNDFHQNFCNIEKACPDPWSCIDLKNGFVCRTNSERPKRDASSNQCNNLLCQNGAVCDLGQCRCLKHYMGKYCSEAVNYCSENPCKTDIKCIPYLGGFTCQCDHNYGGKYCQFPVRQTIYNMQYPNFLYEPLQYAKLKYHYIFHTEELGFRPEIQVNFGDGTVVSKSGEGITLNNAFAMLMKYFSPPLNILTDNLEVYAFSHIYKTPNIYTLKVQAWNNYQEIINSEYEVQVIEVQKCSLNVTLHNAASEKTVLNLYRQNAINFMSRTWSNCMSIKLRYRWEIYKVKSFGERLNKENLFEIREYKVELQNSYLEIPPFALDYGNYTMVLYVEMVQPKEGIRRKVQTWLTIMRRPIIAHIDGGKTVLKTTRSMFFVDASMSYDPNYEKHRQPPMTFTWICIPRSKFCRGFQKLRTNRSVLIVPARAIGTQLYKFKVWVSHYKDTELTEFSGQAEQDVVGTDTYLPNYLIKCLRNCLGGKSNNMYIIAIRGIVLASFREEDHIIKTWVVYPHPETNQNIVMDMDNTEYTENSSVMILYQEQLESGENFRFLLSGFNPEDTENLRNRNVTFAELNIVTFSPPSNGSCTVFPTEGYAMLTTFSLNCMGFYDHHSAMILYEVVQFVDLEDRAHSGILVGYDYNPSIEEMTLSPGTRKNDYITTLHITATDVSGVSAFVEISVVVFPLIYYLKAPNDVILRFIHMGTGSNSPLNNLLSGGNYFELAQHIISTSYTLKHFLQSDDALYIDDRYSETAVEQVGDILLTYLYQVPVATLQDVKHVATALENILILPSKANAWRASTVLAIDIMKYLIEKLEERFELYDEVIFQNDMDDIGTIFLSIAASILKLPTVDTQMLHDEGFDQLMMNEPIEDINPFSLDLETLAHHNSGDALDFIDRFMSLYMGYKIPNERTTLFTSPTMFLLMKKASPEYLTVQALSLTNKVAVTLFFAKHMFYQNALCNLKVIVMNNNPNWLEGEENKRLAFPFVKIDLTNEADDSPVDADVVVQLRPIFKERLQFYSASLPVVLFWQMQEKHVRVHRIIVPKGGKLLVQFLPLKNGRKLRVVIKKEVRPRMFDFWRSGVTIPQNVPENARDKGLSVFVDDEAQEDNTFYYLGVLPHLDTLKEMMKDVEEPILPHAFHYDDDRIGQRDLPDYYDVLPSATTEENSGGIKYIKHPTTTAKASPGRRTLPYSFAVHSVRCLTWDDTTRRWKPSCNVRASTSSSRVSCNCTGYKPLTVSLQQIPVQYQNYTEITYYLQYVDNPLIPFVVLFSLVLFIGLFKWAATEDHKDRLRRSVCFLVDNYPQCEYCYLVIVHTGRKVKSGTTSNVTIELEGTVATSLPHVLKDWSRDVMERGSQDWFVLKTTKPLGEIYCLHVWTDYSGPRPSWYCNKIIVHDVQEQQVWFFMVDKWFDPINGDGTMSFTIYQTLDENIFATSYQMRENVAREFESGMHGWLSIFYKHPYSNYTRKQRVAVAYMHLVLIMMILILLNELPVADSPQHQMYKTASYEWETHDLLLAIYVLLLAFPIHYVFVWWFRCIRPSSKWTESRVDRNLSRFNMDRDSIEDIPWIDPEIQKRRGKIQVFKRPKPERKRVSFFSNFYEPEGDRKLRSRVSFDKLLREAGDDKVVPLRAPTTQMETEVSSQVDVDLPNPTSLIYGQEVVVQSYCFPPLCVVLAWILLFVTTVPCIYVTIVYGISYGWVLSLHYLVSLALAITLSVTVVEPLKLLFSAVYLFFYNRREYSIEDRSDMVTALNAEYTVPQYLQNHVINKINALRENPMYMPLVEEKVYKVRRNRVSTFLTRMIMADMMLFVLFLLLFFVIISNVFDSSAYRHHQNVMTMLNPALMADVNTEADLVNYLKDTLVANLQHFTNGTKAAETDPLKPAVDEVNFLIGVIRLRQVRKKRSACKHRKASRWSRRCAMIFDDQDYGEGWKDLDESGSQEGSMKEAWLYQKKIPLFGGFWMRRNESSYPAGSYVALLGKTKHTSVMKLEYLAKHNWFDFLTAVVYTDVVLYNLNRHQLTLITLMAERTVQGVYYIYHNIEIVKMQPIEVFSQMYVLIFLLILFAWLVWYIHKESKKYSLLRPKQVFSNRFNVLKRFLLCLGVVNILIYTKKILKLQHYTEKIARGVSEEYIDFSSLAFWDRIILLMIAFMIFLVILQACGVLKTFYRVNLALTVVSKSRTFTFTFYLCLLILAFAWSGYMLFAKISYNFQNFQASFFSVLAFAHRSIKLGHFGKYELGFLTFFYYLSIVVLLLFVFRWLISAMLIHTFSAAKRRAHFKPYAPILSNYTMKYFDSIDISPNHKPFKRNEHLRALEPKFYALGCLFVHFYYSKKGRDSRTQRHMAMEAIAFGVIRKKRTYETELPEHATDRYPRTEQAVALAKSIIITNTLEHKLDYLGAKIDRKIREERYRMILKK